MKLKLSPEAGRDLSNAALVAALAALFRLPRLGLPPEEIFDEVYHAKTALQYLKHQPVVEWVHPPTAKLLIAIPVWLFQYDSWSWRLAPALAGIALAPVFYYLARRILDTERAALLACTLLLCDGVYLVQSRTAMTNIFAVLFQVSAALAIVSAVKEERLPLGGMALAGFCLGLALSTRWTSLWAWGFLGLVMLAVRQWRILKPRELALTVLAFGLIPAVLYALSYIPLLAQRNDFSTGQGLLLAARDLVTEQHRVWRYHADLRAEHPYFSKWYTWPWLVRPTWYYFQQDRCMVHGIVAIGNPALWWVSMPVTLATVAAAAWKRRPRLLFAGLGFYFLYLPWGISPRTLNYSHYLFEAIPYACLCLGHWLDEAWDRPLGDLAKVYVGLVVALFLFFLPFLVALPIPIEWFYAPIGGRFRPWTWFPSWV